MHKYTYLYRTTNEVNDKYYIGIHGTDSNPLIGWDGYLGSGTVLNRAIEKHGTENFVHKPLAIFGDREFAFLMERQYISKCIDDPMCYNIAPGGEGDWSENLEAWRKRDPDAYYAHMHSHGKKISNSLIERYKDPKARKRQSDLMKEVTCQDWYKKNHSQGIREYYSNPENMQHHSEALQRYYADPENKKRHSERTKKALANPKIRKRMSEITTKYFEDPENRKRQSDRLIEANKDPELRKRNSEAQKRVWANPEYKERQSKARKERCAKPEFRMAMSQSIREAPTSKKELAYKLRRAKGKVDRLLKRKQTPSVLRYLDDARLNLHRVTKLLNEFGED